MGPRGKIELVETSAILAFFSTSLLSLLAVSYRGGVEATVLALIPTLFLAHYLADLLSGLIHWVCDSFGCASTRFWGPAFIGPFRRHHDTPRDITKITLSENLGSSAMAGLAVLLLLSHQLVSLDPLTPLKTFGMMLFVLFVQFSVLSNLFHRWAHLRDPDKNQVTRFLQDHNLVIRSEQHWRHHKQNFRVNYCISNGWANQVTNRIPWVLIEQFMAKFGARTNFL